MVLFAIYSTHWHINCVKLLLWKIENVIPIQRDETRFCCDEDDVCQVMVTRRQEAEGTNK